MRETGGSIKRWSSYFLLHLQHHSFCALFSFLLFALTSVSSEASVVVQPPEPSISWEARQIQSVAAMQVTWSAMLDALAARDVQRAASFIYPERRIQFIEFMKAANRLSRISAMRNEINAISCRLINEMTGECTVRDQTTEGVVENVAIPFIHKDGVWYINL